MLINYYHREESKTRDESVLFRGFLSLTLSNGSLSNFYTHNFKIDMLKAAFKNYFKNIYLLLIIAVIIYVVAAGVAGVVFLMFREFALDPNSAVLAEFQRLFQEAFEPLGPTDILGGGIGMLVEYFAYALWENFEVSRGGLLFVLIASLFVLAATAFAAGFMTSFIIRRKFKRKDTLKWYIAVPFKWGLGFAFAALFAFAMYHFVLAIIPFVLAFLVLEAVQNIIEVRIIYFRERKLFGEMLNLKTVTGKLVANIALFAMTAVVPIIIWIVFGVIFNPGAGFWLAVAVGAPLFIYYFQITGFTALRYFMEKFEKQE